MSQKTNKTPQSKKKIKKETLKKIVKKPKKSNYNSLWNNNEYSKENCRDLMSENYLGLPGFF